MLCNLLKDHVKHPHDSLIIPYIQRGQWDRSCYFRGIASTVHLRVDSWTLQTGEGVIDLPIGIVGKIVINWSTLLGSLVKWKSFWL